MNDITIDKTGWKKYRYGDVAIQTKEIVDMDNTELTRYVAGEHMNSEDIHIRRWGTVGDGYLGPAFIRRFHKGDILYGSRRTYLKKVAIADFDGITANTTFVIKPKEELIEPVLLVHLMLSKSFTEYSVTNSRGSVNPYINWKDIADYEFLLPPKPEQKRLAALLWAADEMIEKEKVELEKVFIIKNQFIEQTQIQLVQKTKDKYRLGDIVTLNYGKALKESDRIEGKYYVVGSSGISGTHTSFIVNGPGIVVGRKGAAGSVVWVDNNFWPIDTAYWVSMKRNDIDIKYIYILLQSLNLPQLSITTAIPGLNREDVYEQIVYISSTKDQKRIIDEYNKITTSIEKIPVVIKQSQQIKQELINKTF